MPDYNTEKSRFGGPGIDTDYERRILEYKPSFSYEIERIENPEEYLSKMKTENPVEILPDEEAFKYPYAEILYREFKTTKEKLEKLIQGISEKNKTVEAFLPDQQLKELAPLAKAFGYDMKSAMPFPLYEKALESLHTREGRKIAQAFEAFHKGVEGNLNVELYRDAFDLHQDLSDLSGFIASGFYGLFTDQKIDLMHDHPDVLDMAIQKEKEWVKSYAAYLSVSEDIEKVRDQFLFSTDNESDDYFKAIDAYESHEREVDKIEKHLGIRQDTYRLSHKRMEDISETADYIASSIDFAPLKGYLSDILFEYFKKKPSLSSSAEELSSIMHLAVDRKNKTLDRFDHKLHKLIDRNKKKRLYECASEAVHVKNSLLIEAEDFADHFMPPAKEKAYERFAHNLVDGIIEGDSVYEKMMEDSYNMHLMESQVRWRRLVALMDKESARSIHRSVQNMKNITGKDSLKDENALYHALKTIEEEKG